MKVKRSITGLFGLLLLLGTGAAFAQGSEPLGTGFTYQGRLTGNDDPVNGACDVRLIL